jgi:hypothetical protein
MKRLVIMTVVKMCAEAFLIAFFIGTAIVLIGNMNKWDTSLEYSNAFTIAGFLVIIAGASSRLGSGQEWNNFQGLYAESFRDMNAGERANFIINASSSFRLVILGLLSGLLLILSSVLVLELF